VNHAGEYIPTTFSAEQEEHEDFQITDDSTAEWAVRKIKDAQQDTEKWRQHFADQLQAIANSNQSTINYMTSLLGGYFAIVPHRETTMQAKYELPSATLIRKQQQPEYSRDNDTLLRYADENQRVDFIRVKREPNWEAIKAASTVQGETLVDTETGEIIPGITVVARPDKFDVKIKEDANHAV
jgi:hypothetical protein